MKRISFLVTVIILMIAVAACKPGSGSAVQITLVNNKIEIDTALKEFAADYEKKTGVRVIVRSFGSEEHFAPYITAMFNSGNEPEIFIIEGRAGFEEVKRSGRITDLSDEPWVKDTDVAFVDPENGMIAGFPVAIEGWGLGYNKTLLDKAGIDPSSLVNVSAIKAAFEKLDSMKDDLGIDAVVSMAAGPGMTWVMGLHGVNAYLSLGLPYNNSFKYIDMLLDRQVDNERLFQFAGYYNLLFGFSNRNTLLSGSYEQQISEYAAGKTVFIHQGNWVDPTLSELGISFEMGYIPHAFLEETTDGIFVSVPSWYIVNAKSKNVNEAKRFLTAIAATKEGHDYMVNKAGMVSAFKSVTLRPAGQLSRAVQDWVRQGKIYAWHQYEMPESFGMNVLGPLFHQLASGHIDVDEFTRLFTNAVLSQP
ncbi:MAG: ABC transporter substrate-binding protein [Treponema sp.]|nr:ABC transporter substrate-binding protein [Treponema sp.]